MITKPSQTQLIRTSERSLYEQLTDQLRTHVLSHLSPGSKLSTEAQLVKQFSVSRSTVRKSIKALVDEGILTTRQGKGTFVVQRNPNIVHAIDRVAPFMDTFNENGLEPTTEVISFEWKQSLDLPAHLNTWERPILVYKRLYKSQGSPHAITRVCVPRTIGNQISLADCESKPIYDILKKKCGLTPLLAEFLVSAQQPSTDIAQALQVSISTFLLVLQRITLDSDENPVEMTTHYLRPDVYKLSVSLSNIGA